MIFQFFWAGFYQNTSRPTACPSFREPHSPKNDNNHNRTLMPLFLVGSLKERQWWMAIMLRILWLISPWQPRYFFGSETLIFLRPRVGLASSRPSVTQAAQRGYSRKPALPRSAAAATRGPRCAGRLGEGPLPKKGEKKPLRLFFPLLPISPARGSVHVLADILVPGSCFMLSPATPRSGEAGLARVWDHPNSVTYGCYKCNSQQLF